MIVLPARVFHEDFELEVSFDPGGTLSDVIRDPLDPGSNNTLTGLKLPPRDVEDTETKTTGRLDSFTGVVVFFSIDLEGLNMPKLSNVGGLIACDEAIESVDSKMSIGIT